jgi:hypothetical protein
METPGQQQRNWLVALSLSVFCGVLGADRFYLGKIGTGFLKLMTAGGLGIWWLIDVILIATERATDAQGLSLERSDRMARSLRGVWLVLFCASPILVMGTLVGGILFAVTTIMKSSDAYKIATEYVSRDERVIAEIGEVTGFGFLPGGNISTSGPTGEAELSIHAQGDRGSGTLYIELTKALGEWKIVKAEFETSAGRRFDLLMPGDQALRGLVTETLLEFDAAIQAQDFSSFHAALAEIWKSQITPDQLQEAFQTFILDEVQIGGVRDVAPVFDEPPAIGEDGILTLAGYFPTTPLRVLFNLKYRYEHPTWKLTGIRVSLRE